MKNTFLIVGKTFSSLRETIESRGDKWVLLKDGPATTESTKNCIEVDFSDSKELIKAVERIDIKIDGVIAIYENYIVHASQIALQLGVPALPLQSAKACTDKDAMRSLFLKSPEPISPQYSVIVNYGDAKNFAQEHGYPLILKPANLAKSLLVLRCNDETELKQNYEIMFDKITDVYKKYAPHQKPKIIIEEFLEGTIHSVDAFVDSTGRPYVLDQIVDYQTGYDIGYDDNFHYSRILPSKLNPNQQDALKHVAELGCQALGMKNSAAHIEIIMTKNGPRIVEIGARNGGYRERMHKLANGIEVLNLQLDLKLGINPKIKVTKNESVAVLELFPKNPGIFKKVSNELALKQLPSLKYFRVKQKIGEFVGKAGDGYKMCAIIILHNKDAERFATDLAYVQSHCTIITE